MLLLIALAAATGGFLSQDAEAQSTGSITRSVLTTSVAPGDLVTVTLTPTGISDFYAARENLGVLRLVEHDADVLDDGAFINITNSPIAYVVEIPVGASPGQQFAISGDFWEDPGAESAVDPVETVLTVATPDMTMDRHVEGDTLGPGETATVTLTPSGVSDFYAVQEDFDGLVLLSHDADAFDSGVFVRVGTGPIQYTVELPASAQNGDVFDISGMFWDDPDLRRRVEPAASRITANVPEPTVARTLSKTTAQPGDLVTVTIDPGGVELFYAVEENLGSLKLISHTADGLEQGAFISLTADPFDYTVRVPLTANDGDQLTITGQFWEDPGALRDVSPAVSTILVSTTGPPASAMRTADPSSALAGETITFTITPSNVDLFYAIEEDLDGLELVSHTADGFDNGAFIKLTATPFQYTARIPEGALGGDQFRVSGVFLEDPGSPQAITPAETVISVSGGTSAIVERSLSALTAAPGDLVDVTLTPSQLGLFYAVEEDLAGLELVSHNADNLEDGIFIRLSATPINYTVRVPADAVSGDIFNITGQFWEDPYLKLEVSPAASQLRVKTTPARVDRAVDNLSVDPGDVVTVSVTPSNIDLFYAVEEDLGELELVSHTADAFMNGAFLMLTADPFEYVVRVPDDAGGGDAYPISGEFWEDPGFRQAVSPRVTELSIGPAIGLSFEPNGIPLGIGETRTVEVHVDDLLGQEVDTVQLKITHDPAEIELSGVDCIGILDSGSPSEIFRDEAAGASWFTCSTTDQGGVSGESGPLISFDVTRLGTSLPTLEMISGGPTGTELFRQGLSIDTRVVALNTLEILPDTTLSGSVTIQGVVDEPAFAVVGPTISLIPTEAGRPTSKAVSSDGTFAIEGVVDGTYDVLLDAPGALGRLLTGLVVSGEDIELQPVELRGGRADADDIVAGADISAVSGHFGASPNELNGRTVPETGIIVDFDGDGWVTAFDISIVQSNMGETRIQEWTDPAVSS